MHLAGQNTTPNQKAQHGVDGNFGRHNINAIRFTRENRISPGIPYLPVEIECRRIDRKRFAHENVRKPEVTCCLRITPVGAHHSHVRHKIASYIKEELVSKNLVKDPVVTVEFMNLTVSVLGEVANPGRFNIDKDKLTLLDALSMAGDLTVYGKRENVLVQREENGKQTLYQVNLNSGYDLYASPVYYLQQNDIVYVEPNSMKARQATVNGNNVRSASFWMSLASLLTTITVLIVK